eukprot:Tbor_TRINITY_DN4344_c0_g1::TRINITY_DN4344_c0_g1_i1::g.7823::m.7823/K18037/PTPN4, MEG; tyrosine-protein phosphatase non-receptor type 4
MSIWQRNTAGALRDILGALGDRTPDNRDGFDDEFDALRSIDAHVRENVDEFYTAALASNMSKNRYRDVLPNEGTRVVLDPLTARGDGDYINASYVDGRRLFGTPFVYIASQAPLESTLGDFWRMVWENNSVFIVMLCAEIEGGKSKSCRYFPISEGGIMYCGTLTVVLHRENRHEDTVFRNISIRNEEGLERNILHMQHIRWPDQGIPHSSHGLMEMVYALGKSKRAVKTPIVVHCSGGVGRTGVFIAFHVALALFQLERPISVPRIVQYLKYCRTGMVQRKDQYLFLYYAILREMEKMLWAYEHRPSSHMAGRSLQAIQDSSVNVAKRGSEYYPLHVFPECPLIDKSRVFAGDRTVIGLDDDSFVDSYDPHEYGGQRSISPGRNGIYSGTYEMYAGEQNKDLQQQRELELLVRGRSQPRPIRQSHPSGGQTPRKRSPVRSVSQTQNQQSKTAYPHKDAARSELSTLALNQQNKSVSRPYREPDYGPMTPVEEQLSILKAQNRRMRRSAAATNTAVRGTDDIYNSRAVSPMGLGIHPSAAPVLHNILPRNTPGRDYKSLSEQPLHSYNQEYLQQQKQREVNNKIIAAEVSQSNSQRMSNFQTGRPQEEGWQRFGGPILTNPSPVHTDLSHNTTHLSNEAVSPEVVMKGGLGQQTQYVSGSENSVKMRTTLLQNSKNNQGAHQQQTKNAPTSLGAVRAAVNVSVHRNNDGRSLSNSNRQQYAPDEVAVNKGQVQPPHNEFKVTVRSSSSEQHTSIPTPADTARQGSGQPSQKQKYFFDSDAAVVSQGNIDSSDIIAGEESNRVNSPDFSLL